MNTRKLSKNTITLEFDPSTFRYPSFPYPYFEKEPCDRFWQKFRHFPTVPNGSCMFQSLSFGYNDNSKYWKKYIKRTMLRKVQKLTLSDKMIVYGLRDEREIIIKHSEVLRVLEDDHGWGFLDHLNLFERFFNASVWVWSRVGDYFQVTRRPQIDNNDHVPKFIHLLHDGGSSEENHCHYSYLKQNMDYVGTIARSARMTNDEVIELEDDNSSISEFDLTQDLEICLRDMDEDEVFLNAQSLKDHTDNIISENQNMIKKEFPLDSGSTQTSSNRPSNDEFQAGLTRMDMISTLSSRLGKKGYCCERQCLRLILPQAAPFRLESSFTDRPLEILYQCRQFVRRMSQKERSSFVEDGYKKGFQKSSSGDVEFKMMVDIDENDRKEVCWRSFDVLYGITDSMSLRTRKRIKEEGLMSTGKRKMTAFITSVAEEDTSTKQLDEDSYSMIAFIRTYCEERGERMPNSDDLRISFSKRIVFQSFVQNFPNADESKFYRLWNNYCADIKKCRWKGDFAVCDTCKKCAQVDCSPQVNQETRKENKIFLKRHLKSVQLMRYGYALRREKAREHPSTFMSMIIDACDSNTTTLPNIKSMSKSEDKYREYMLKHKVMGVRVHGLRNRDYLYMSPPFLGKKVGSNLTIEALAKTLKYEEKLRLDKRKTCFVFPLMIISPFFTSSELGWPSTLFLQLDNTSKENKNQYVFAYLTHLVNTGVFKTIYLSFLVPGHTHEDIDQLFSVLTKALRKKDAYTFEQWKSIVDGAFNDEFNKIYHVEYLWSTLDYRSWLGELSQNVYTGYRKTYHFRIRKWKDDESAITQYTQFCYEGDFVNSQDQIQYFPSVETSKAYSFLLSFRDGAPITDPTAGYWAGGEDEHINDKAEALHLSKIIELLRLDQNNATEDDVLWWQQLWKNRPKPGMIIHPSQTWKFSLPDVQLVNENSSPENIDIYDLGDVQPLSPYKFEALATTHFPASARAAAIRLAEEYAQMDIPGTISEGDFVIFKVEQPEWSEIARDQTGIHPDALSTEFGMGKVVPNDTEDPEIVCVHVWYASNGGDPNGIWLPWLRKSDDPRERKSSPWIKGIPKDSIFINNVQLNQKKVNSVKLSVSTKRGIHQHPFIPYRYLPAFGLVSDDQEAKTLEQNVLELMGARSKAGRQKLKAAQTKQNRSKAEKRRAQNIRAKKEHLQRLKNAPKTVDDQENKEESDHLLPQNDPASLEDLEEAEEDPGDVEMQDIKSTTTGSENESNHPSSESFSPKISQSLPLHQATTSSTSAPQQDTQEQDHRQPNQRYSFRDETSEAMTVYQIGEVVKCQYRVGTTFYKAQILERNARRGTYRVKYIDFNQTDDSVRPTRLRKIED